MVSPYIEVKTEKNIVFFFAFHFFSLPLHHRLLALSWAAGGHVYEKDVFERLLLCITNLANPYTHSRQMATETSAWYVIYVIYVYTYWRGLTGVVCPV